MALVMMNAIERQKGGINAEKSHLVNVMQKLRRSRDELFNTVRCAFLLLVMLIRSRVCQSHFALFFVSGWHGFWCNEILPVQHDTDHIQLPTATKGSDSVDRFGFIYLLLLFFLSYELFYSNNEKKNLPYPSSFFVVK